MPVRHRLLAALVAVLWGINFVAIHASLEVFPPFLCAALRWLVIAVPTVLFVPRPQVPVRWLLLYGAGFGIAQFVFLYWAMAQGMPSGLASLVLQSSAPFTVLLGALLLRERIGGRRAIGIGIAALGLGIVAAERIGGAGWWPFALTLLGGLGWAVGNLGSRLARPDKPLHLTLWMSVVPPLPMLALSFAVEGPQRIGEALRAAPQHPAALAGLAYTVLIGTIVGSGIWTALLARHPAGVVAPWSMLVPVAGFGAAWVLLREQPAALDLMGAAVVIGGVLLASRSTPRTPISAPSAAPTSGPLPLGAGSRALPDTAR